MSVSLHSVLDAFGYRDARERRGIAALLRAAGVPETIPSLPTLPDTPEPATPQVMMLNPAAIKTDARAYQFRSGGDANGVTAAHRIDDGAAWDPYRVFIVHRRMDGNDYIVDGHHGLAHAQALAARGVGPGKVAALVLDEKDGYTAPLAKLIAAFENIRQDMGHGHGRPGEIADAARVFRQATELPFDHKKLLPPLMLKGDINLSYRMRELPEPALGRVARGEVAPEMAALVAERVSDSQQQDAVMRIIGEKTHADRLRQRRGEMAAMGRG